MSKAGLYYLRNCSAGFVGNSPLLWRKGGSGYTPDLNDAELFTFKAASTIKRSTRGTHSWELIKEKDAKAAAILVIDIQELRKQPNPPGGNHG